MVNIRHPLSDNLRAVDTHHSFVKIISLPLEMETLMPPLVQGQRLVPSLITLSDSIPSRAPSPLGWEDPSPVLLPRKPLPLEEENNQKKG